MPNNRGLVVIKVMTNSARVAGPIYEWNDIALLKNSDEHLLLYSISSLDRPAVSKIFVGMLPEGRYKIARLGTKQQYKHDLKLHAAITIPDAIGEFEIQAGSVTNLGTLIYHPIETADKYNYQINKYLVTRVTTPSLWDSVIESRLDIKRHVPKEAPILGWLSDEYESERVDIQNKIQRHGLPSVLHVLESGDAVIGTKLGKLFIKSHASKNWNYYPLDNTRAITSLIELQDGNVLIGGELGLLEKGRLENETWKSTPITLPDKYASVVSMLEASGLNLILTQSSEAWSLYQYDANKQSFELLKTLPFQALEINRSTTTPFLAKTDKGFSIYYDGICHDYLTASDVWHQAACLNDTPMAQQKNGISRTTSARSSNNSKFLSYSKDFGRSWITLRDQLEVKPVGYSVYYSENGNLLRLDQEAKYNHLDQPNSRHNFPAESFLNNTKVWEKISEFPPQCPNILNVISRDSAMYVLCENGAILLSSDLGKSWQIFFSLPSITPSDTTLERSSGHTFIEGV